MTSIVLSITAVLFSVAILLAGNGLQATFIPLRANIEGFSEFILGIMGSVYFIGFAVGCLVGPRIIQHVGHIRTFAALCAVVASTLLLHSLFIHTATWIGLRFIIGFGFAGLYMVVESWLNERASNEARGRIMGLYAMVMLFALMIGQQSIRLYSIAGFELFVVAAILIVMGLVPLVMTRSEAPPPLESTLLNVRRLISVSPVGTVGNMVTGLTFGAIWTLAPLYGVRIGMVVDNVALFMSAFFLGGALLQWPLGMISDRIDRRIVIAIISLISATAGVFLAFPLTNEHLVFFALSGLLGGFSLPIGPLCMSHANDHTDTKDFVSVAGSLLLLHGLAAMVGPLLAGVLMEFRASYLFAFTAVVHIGFALFVLYRAKTAPALRPEEKEPFVPLGENPSPAVAELDPRGPDEPVEMPPKPAGAPK